MHDPVAKTGPVFVGGCPRSGTTMLGAMLGGAEGCIVTPESAFKVALMRLYARREKPTRDAVLGRLKRHPSTQIWGLDLATVDPKDIPVESAERVSLWVVDQYRSMLGLEAGIWIDHTPDNIRYAHSLGRRFRAAKFIHLVRDGRAVAASVLGLDWGPNTIDRAARWWLEYVAHGLAAERLLGSNRVLLVRYEDIVNDPRRELARTTQFLGLPYTEAMLDGSALRVPLFTVGQHRLVGTAPQKERVAAWRSELTTREIERFEGVASGVLTALGYSPVFGDAAQPASRAEKGRSALTEAMRTLANRRRKGRRFRTTTQD